MEGNLKGHFFEKPRIIKNQVIQAIPSLGGGDHSKKRLK